MVAWAKHEHHFESQDLSPRYMIESVFGIMEIFREHLNVWTLVFNNDRLVWKDLNHDTLNHILCKAIPYFHLSLMEHIIYCDTKVVVVENDELQDVEVGVVVDIIMEIWWNCTNSTIWLIVLEHHLHDIEGPKQFSYCMSITRKLEPSNESNLTIWIGNLHVSQEE